MRVGEWFERHAAAAHMPDLARVFDEEMACAPVARRFLFKPGQSKRFLKTHGARPDSETSVLTAPHLSLTRIQAARTTAMNERDRSRFTW